MEDTNINNGTVLGEEEIEFINSNPKLIDYICRLYKTNKLLNSRLKWMVLGCLVSSDTIVSYETALKSFSELIFIRDNYEMLNLDGGDSERLFGMIESGLEICQMDLEKYAEEEENAHDSEI